jgi:phospholipid N-methyltransferase
MLRRFLDTPRIIGAVAPSSPALAKVMTQQIGGGVAVFEVGAGTGAITQQILQSALAGPLVVFEQDRMLAESLRRRMGQVRVVEGLFHDTIADFDEIPDALVILSSVPFVSLPQNLRFKTVEAISHILLASPNRRLIQYTYFGRPPFVPRHPGLQWRRLARVWSNIPPATVWELRAGMASRSAFS